MMPPRSSVWKAQGETSTTSLSRIKTRLFIFPRIRQRHWLPSWHLTKTRSEPRSLTTAPRTSLELGRPILFNSSSVRTFFFLNRAPQCSHLQCSQLLINVDWGSACIIETVATYIWLYKSGKALQTRLTFTHIMSPYQLKRLGCMVGRRLSRSKCISCGFKLWGERWNSGFFSSWESALSYRSSSPPW